MFLIKKLCLKNKSNKKQLMNRRKKQLNIIYIKRQNRVILLKYPFELKY